MQTIRDAKKPLSAYRILVTRPAHQAAALMAALQEKGAEVILFPTIEIVGNPLSLLVQAQLAQPGDIWIFTSANAVQYALPWMERSSQALPTHIAAIGQATADKLRTAGYDVSIETPPPYHSEHLLQHEALQQLTTKRIILFQGLGGRALLADSLTVRGAQVTLAQVYQRKCPDVEPTSLLKRLACAEIDVIIVTSISGLENCLTLLASARDILQHVPFVVISARLQAYAKQQGLKTYLAAGPDEASILACLLKELKT